MRPTPEVHDALACLLTYPGEPHGPLGQLDPTEAGGGNRYPGAVQVIARACPETTEALERFLGGIAGHAPGELEELYTRTFDNVADRSLEVGWQLFGENYARGALMVRLRELMRRHDVPEHTELPDHLTHVLALLGRAPAELAASLAANQVHQALEKMLEGLRAIDSPWTGVLEATDAVLARHANDEPVTAEATR
jgi:nitrate reductase assembly molybdenum cofactor insertion protein NarJ